ncbi:MAG: hypothetical protein CMJ70_12385 [Planctomycetaceae bacterium]|nr:hypothetical protein [Planctomycetaceae bacterium]
MTRLIYTLFTFQVPCRLFLGVFTALVLLIEVRASTAQDATPTVRIGRPAGVARYWKNTWGVVGVDATNPTAAATEILASLHFEGESTMQYARQLWVPPHAVRHSWLPVLVPALPRVLERPTIAFKGNAYELKNGRQNPLPNPAGRRLQSDVLEFGNETKVTGILSDQGDWDTPERHDFAFEAIAAVHRTGRMARRVQEFPGSPLPPLERALEGLDHLVISHNQLATDGAGTTAIRQWLYRGGVLWVMLDRVDLETVGRLLGNPLDWVSVGRVDLIETDLRNVAGTALEDQPFRLPEPMPFIQMILPDQGVEVTHTQNGWPASFWVSAGRGKVLFTTLAPRAWIRRSDPATTDVADMPAGFGFGPVDELSAVEEQATHQASPPLAQLATDFLEESSEPLLEARELKFYLDDEIGYQVVARGIVVLVLGTFSFGLPVLSFLLDARQKRDWLVWLIPATAVVAAGLLVILGGQSRRAVPPTAAMVQLATATPNTNEVMVDGLLAIYNQQQVAARYGAERGGVFLPNVADSGQTRRIVWTGIDQWQWDNVTLPAASVRIAPFRSVVRLNQPLEFVGSFNADGFVGSFRGETIGPVEDALMVVPGGNKWRVRFQDTGQGALEAGDLIAGGSYLSDGLMSDKQRRRQSVYRQLFRRSEELGFPTEPTLFVWASAFDTQFVFSPEVEQRSSALLAVPVGMESPQPGTEVLIPNAFLRCRSIPGPEQRAASPLFNHRTGNWLEAQRAGKVWLRFELPPELRTLRIKQATINMKMVGQGWNVRLSGLSDSASRLIVEKADWSNESSFQLDRPEWLKLDREGGIVIGLDVTPVRDPSDIDPPAPWKIEFVRMEVTGQMPK